MKLWIFIPVFFMLGFTFSHKYFHSYTDLQVSSATGNGEAALQLFWHDLEFSLTKQNNQSITTKSPDFLIKLQEYLKSHFQLRGKDGKVISFIFIGYQIERDEIEIYLEYKQLTDFSGLKLENTLLTDEFPEQVNQVSVKQKNKKNTYVFTSKKKEFQL